MKRFLLKRILMLVPVLLGVTIIIFTLMYITPGDPVDSILGDSATEQTKADLREELGLNGTYIERLGGYITGLLHGDMGICYATRQNVADRIVQSYPNTVKLAGVSMLWATVFGLTFGIVSAVRQYSFLDNIVMCLAMIGTSIPVFWNSLLLILLFSVKLNVLSASGLSSPRHLILPAFALGLQSCATITRMTRSSMLEVVRQDYISTARAKGQTEYKITVRHALKNALIPVVTVIGMQFGLLLGGAVVTESIFSISGIGKMMVDAVNARNYPVVQGGVLAIALVFSVINLLVDILYAYIDPRIRSQYH